MMTQTEWIQLLDALKRLRPPNAIHGVSWNEPGKDGPTPRVGAELLYRERGRIQLVGPTWIRGGLDQIHAAICDDGLMSEARLLPGDENRPLPPEIAVSDAMLEATKVLSSKHILSQDDYALIYQTMEAARREEQGKGD
jgi:hypothetical protein